MPPPWPAAPGRGGKDRAPRRADSFESDDSHLGAASNPATVGEERQSPGLWLDLKPGGTGLELGGDGGEVSLQIPLSQVGLAVAPALHLFFTPSGICIRRDAQRELHRGSDSLTSLSLSAKMREIAQFRYLLGLPAIVHFGMLAGPWGDGLNAPPSGEDIGSVAAGVLAEPAPHIGKCYRPTGPKLISPHDMADILTDVVGRKVKYQDVSLKMFLKAAKAQGVSAFEIGHIGFYFEEIRGGTYAVGAPTDHVQEICGRPPESFETVARRYIAQPDLIYPGLRAGTKLGALALAGGPRSEAVAGDDRGRTQATAPAVGAGAGGYPQPAVERGSLAGGRDRLASVRGGGGQGGSGRASLGVPIPFDGAVPPVPQPFGPGAGGALRRGCGPASC